MNISSWLFVDYLPCCFLHTDRVEDPVHPTEVFDMIVGTSTGNSNY